MVFGGGGALPIVLLLTPSRWEGPLALIRGLHCTRVPGYPGPGYPVPGYPCRLIGNVVQRTPLAQHPRHE